MHQDGPLLTARLGKDGRFVDWLKQLGLDDFLRRYPLQQLVQWGWLVPQHRLIFPQQFFLEWANFPTISAVETDTYPDHHALWDSTWSTEPGGDELWAVHPFFHPTNSCAVLLREEGRYSADQPLPPAFDHPRGQVKIAPYVDFFFHWQAYALIDIALFADCIAPIFNTPEISAQAQGIVRIAARLETELKPDEVLRLETRWGGLGKVMTWISHYRALESALSTHHLHQDSAHKQRRNDRRAGAVALAKHLGVTAECLTDEVETRLLVLAGNWQDVNRRKRHWVEKAWPLLQDDIRAAVTWLCFLTDQTLDYYLEKWTHRACLPQRWAQLSDVLPYDFWADRVQFLQLAPRYLEEPNLRLDDADRFLGTDLARRVEELSANNYPFSSFLGAFRSFHDDLGRRTFDEPGYEFRDLRPMDGYSLLAIRVEGVLIYAVDRIGPVAELKNPGLQAYIWELSRRNKLSQQALDSFSAQCAALTKLHKRPENPIRSIMAVNPPVSPRESALVKAFLCSVLARNYFAHHYYLDGKQLPKSEESGFLLCGLIATVLCLA